MNKKYVNLRPGEIELPKIEPTSITAPWEITHDFSPCVEYVLKCSEDEDNFMFEHFSRYLKENVETEDYQMKIPKKLLLRAIECFRTEHKDEWNIIMEEHANE